MIFSIGLNYSSQIYAIAILKNVSVCQTYLSGLRFLAMRLPSDKTISVVNTDRRDYVALIVNAFATEVQRIQANMMNTPVLLGIGKQ